MAYISLACALYLHYTHFQCKLFLTYYSCTNLPIVPRLVAGRLQLLCLQQSIHKCIYILHVHQTPAPTLSFFDDVCIQCKCSKVAFRSCNMLSAVSMCKLTPNVRLYIGTETMFEFGHSKSVYNGVTVQNRSRLAVVGRWVYIL